MKVIIALSLPLVVLLTAALWKTNLSYTDISASTPSPASSAPSKQTPKVWTDATTVYQNESFALHFTTPNAPYLGVVDPKGRFFYLVFPKETAEGNLTPLVDSERFVHISQLQINTARLKADPYTYGVYENQPVFTCSGTYTFILGENLHVDDPSLLSTTQIKYIHRPRAATSSSNVAMN